MRDAFFSRPAAKPSGQVGVHGTLRNPVNVALSATFSKPGKCSTRELADLCFREASVRFGPCRADGPAATYPPFASMMLSLVVVNEQRAICVR